MNTYLWEDCQLVCLRKDKKPFFFYLRTTATHTPIVNSAQQTKSWKEIPGPSLWDLMKQALPGASGDLNLTDGLKLGQALYDHYGPIVKLDGFLGRPPIILLYDPEQCAQVLRSENWLPIRSGFQSLDYYRRNKRNKGNENQSNPDMTGLLTDHGETWKKFRSTVNPVLLQPKTIKLYTSIIDEVAQDMIVRTSNTITASLYLLANNQDKQDKLRAEILSITDENQKRSYLRACVKESMRIMPVVSGNIREATKEYVIFGYSIPPGIGISFMHQAMSMMEEHYPRPTEFLPERWLVKKGDPLYHGNAHPFVNQPFGFGVRSCIGRRIAELEIYTFLSRLIQNFRVEWFGPPMQTKVASINYITGPHNFIFKDA
uniref:CYP333B26 n=1 Tax=Chilo suppressalis TaxID=168631 RepID=X5D9G3_CHISP|nr:CYP333B26 [Chilo suppressalis]